MWVDETIDRNIHHIIGVYRDVVRESIGTSECTLDSSDIGIKPIFILVYDVILVKDMDG